MKAENRVVNGLWIGTQLSNIELLTLHSFIAQGHHFRLWVYDELETPVPAGVELADGNEIIPREKIFRYKHTNSFGHGKGSVSGFSDIFRYKLLYDHGGWWVDMDMTCLKVLDFDEPYVFRNHHELAVVGNAMKCPKGSPVMLDCYNEASERVTEENRDWHLPITILNEQIEKHDLLGYIKPEISNNDMWDELQPFVTGTRKIPATYHLIHWLNEEWRSRGLDKNQVRKGSALGKLMIQYGLITPHSSSKEAWNEYLYYSWPARIARKLF